ncbi:MAG: ABC transporter substrate-binding protein [Acidimicrobiales bacterium]
MAACSMLTAVLAASLTVVPVSTAGASAKKVDGIPFKHGRPTLSGISISVGNAAGSAHIGDTNVHDLVNILKQWGASTTQTNASKNAVELAVAAGKEDLAVGPLPTEVDTGLVAFGPNLVHLTDGILAKSTIKGLKGLKGKTIAYCCQASPDGVLLTAVLKKAGLKKTQVSLLATGASTASLDALIAGKVTAAFTALGGLPTAANSFHLLTDAEKLLPAYADSFMSATPQWLKTHKKEAVAVDLAWLAAAKLFNGSESGWVKNAATYTSSADTTAQYQAAWKQLKTLTGWPVKKSAYTVPVVKYNLKIATQQTSLKGTGTKPFKKITTFTVWQTAWSIWKKHQKKL